MNKSLSWLLLELKVSDDQVSVSAADTNGILGQGLFQEKDSIWYQFTHNPFIMLKLTMNKIISKSENNILFYFTTILGNIRTNGIHLYFLENS